jgi:hypothetical protein
MYLSANITAIAEMIGPVISTISEPLWLRVPVAVGGLIAVAIIVAKVIREEAVNEKK